MSILTVKEVSMLTDQFLIDLKQKYIDTICTFNQDTAVETRQWDFHCTYNLYGGSYADRSIPYRFKTKIY